MFNLRDSVILSKHARVTNCPEILSNMLLNARLNKHKNLLHARNAHNPFLMHLIAYYAHNPFLMH